MSNMNEILDRLLDNGTTLSFDSNDLCCPDCLQVVGAVPASPMLTTHEVNDNNYRIYVLSNVDTFLDYVDYVGLIGQPNLLNCCLHYEASMQKSTELAESLGYDIPNNLQSCSTNFNSCISDLLNTFNSDSVQEILDGGIVEYGSISGQSQVCILKSFVDLAYNSQNQLSETRTQILDRILDKGIVVSCYNGEMSISTVETFQEWYQIYIAGQIAALNNKNNI